MASAERQTPFWLQEFDESYAVPDVIANDPRLDDTSWHNDVCPSFTARDYEAGDGDKPDVRLWVNAIKVEDREFAEQPRLMLGDGTTVIATWNDDADAGQAVEMLLALCAKGGRQ